jgi:hypothetical protein
MDINNEARPATEQSTRKIKPPFLYSAFEIIFITVNMISKARRIIVIRFALREKSKLLSNIDWLLCLIYSIKKPETALTTKRPRRIIFLPNIK